MIITKLINFLTCYSILYLQLWNESSEAAFLSSCNTVYHPTTIQKDSIIMSVYNKASSSSSSLQNKRMVFQQHGRNHRILYSYLFESNSNDNNNDQRPPMMDNNKNEKGVKVGTQEYYSGFISRDINEEPKERITGDAVLIPTLKFVGGFAAIIVVLFVGFLLSNDLL